jgi:hypothetical protein
VIEKYIKAYADSCGVRTKLMTVESIYKLWWQAELIFTESITKDW